MWTFIFRVFLSVHAKHGWVYQFIYNIGVEYSEHWNISSLQWRHNERDGVSNHQRHDCLLNRLYRRRSKKTSKLRFTSLCAGNSPVTGEFPAQKASNVEKCSHLITSSWTITTCTNLGSIQYVNHINISISSTLRFERILDEFCQIVFRESDKSGLAELVGEYKDANGVYLLDWCVIWVQVLQESFEGTVCRVRDADLNETQGV